MADWTVAAAKAKLSELVTRAHSDGPQAITRHGRPVAVVVSTAEWERKTRRSGSLADFFAASPLRGTRVKATRTRLGVRISRK
jgi:prevent-host-death family protein